MCFLIEDSNEWINKHSHNADVDDETLFPKWFYLPYCDECEKI